jgi:hypothetical protein
MAGFVRISRFSRRVPRRTSRQPTMIETNPILAQIADLTGRVESLRGYL